MKARSGAASFRIVANYAALKMPSHFVTNVTFIPAAKRQCSERKAEMFHQLRGTAMAPVIVGVRGPSRSGKTALIERLIPLLGRRGCRVAYVKRTHHRLDLPEKASGRIWAVEPAAMVLHAVDRLQITVTGGERSVEQLVAHVPMDVDVVLLETHSPERLPTILSRMLEQEPGEAVIGRWSLGSIDDEAPVLAALIEALLPDDLVLSRALSVATQAHGGHACAGLVLGTRLALVGAATLGVDVPDCQKRLIVAVETDRCAVDAIQAVTGCRPGRRTLRLLDYGKLAATFIDQWNQTAIRVATRGDLRERVGDPPGGIGHHDFQRDAYLAMAPEELFNIRDADPFVARFDLPGSPLRRVNCGRCGEEVSDGREVASEIGPVCRTCGDLTTGPISVEGESMC